MAPASSIHVEKPGLLATIQDAGRFGHAHEGISACGAADLVALRLGNGLVGNPMDAAVIEMTLVGGTLVFEEETLVAITGADFSPRLAGQAMPLWEPLAVRAGDRLELGASRGGARAYVCVAGGIDVPPVLGSRSTHLRSRLGGLEGRALVPGDRLPIGAGGSAGASAGASASQAQAARRRLDPETIRRLYAPGPMRVTEGLQASEFAPEVRERLCAASWSVREQSDRMGIRLAGPVLPRRGAGDLLTEGVALGAIQVPPDGQPIVLFVDHRTTGGYPKIANVCSADLHRLGQLRPRDAVRFESVSFESAATLLGAFERQLGAMEAGFVT